MHYSVFGIICHLHSIKLVHHLSPPSHHPSLPLSSIPDLKPRLEVGWGPVACNAWQFYTAAPLYCGLYCHFNVRQYYCARYWWTSVCPSVRPYVRSSVTWTSYCVETAQPIVKLSSLPGSPKILVFEDKTFFPEFLWEHPNEGVKM